MKYVILIGRILFALIFIMAGFSKFSGETIQMAASQGVPAASLLVPVAGVMAILGGFSIALGYRAKWGALLIVAFLMPVTLMMHNFWSISDPMMIQMQQAMFFKNLAMVGGALFLAFFGSGPLSLDRYGKRQQLQEGLV